MSTASHVRVKHFRVGFSVVMTAAYAWRRDLLANSTAHSLGLVAGLLRI